MKLIKRKKLSLIRSKKWHIDDGIFIIQVDKNASKIILEGKENRTMKWILKGIDKETEHRFLNFYTVHYDVIEDDGIEKNYSYFLASRNENKDDLRIVTRDIKRADAVLVGCYMIKNNILYLLLEQQFRPALNRFVVSFPAGLMDKDDQDVYQTARREVKEETGYEVDELEMLLPPSPTSEGLSDECNSVVLAKLCSKGTDNKEEFEDITSKMISAKDVKMMLNDSEILFSNSARILILYMLERFKNNI